MTVEVCASVWHCELTLHILDSTNPTQSRILRSMSGLRGLYAPVSNWTLVGLVYHFNYFVYLVIWKNTWFILKLFQKSSSCVAAMGNFVTVLLMFAVGLVFCTHMARPTSTQSLAYQELLQKNREGEAPKMANSSQTDWAYNSQTSAFEKALREGKNFLG